MNRFVAGFIAVGIFCLPPIAADPNLPCSSAYLIQNRDTGSGLNELYEVDLASGKTTLVNGNVNAGPPGSAINAIGFNSRDSFMYGTATNAANGTRNLIRVGAGGKTTVLPIQISFDTVVGDVAANGQYYIRSTAGVGNVPWAQLDLSDSNSPTFGRVVASGTSDSLGLAMFDWAHVPGAGDYLWSYGFMYPNEDKNVLVRWDIQSHAYVKVRDLGISGRYGAMYASADGYLYGEESGSGSIYRVKVADSTAPVKFIAKGPASSGNDGAGCGGPLAPLPPTGPLSPLKCSSSGYLIQNTKPGSDLNWLYSVDVSGMATLVNSNVNAGPSGSHINAIGFNIRDGYIYGTATNSANQARNLIRIGDGGMATVLPYKIPFATVTGDIAPDGQYYILQAFQPDGAATSWAQLDLSDSKSSTFGLVVASGTSDQILPIFDWAHVPGTGNYLWSFGVTNTGNNFLIRWDMSTHIFTVIRDLGVSGRFGAVYAAADGYLYGADSISGNVYRVKVTNNTSRGELVGKGPASDGNDGASCPVAN
ncbi:uncharacterized protein G6M90_00g080350 [Metarhizium brunneum]|uniref:DUF6923 domain-containing protein n=1 Tax=Metarhizium brunneum TaxID=500148 RepID=A0A7D5Z127_9HYPO